jgi:hypothetical protein
MPHPKRFSFLHMEASWLMELGFRGHELRFRFWSKKEKKGKEKTQFTVNSFVLVCSLSSHRHLFIPLIFGSRFDS